MRDSGPKILPQNQLNIYILTVEKYWLGKAKPKNVFRLIPPNSWKIKKILHLIDFSTV